MRLVAALLPALMVPAIARGHDFWAERTADGFTVRYGHRGGETLPIVAAKIKTIQCLDEAGALDDVLRSAYFAPQEVTVAARCDALAVFHDGGFYSLTPDGEVNLPKDKAENAVKSW